MPAREAEPSLRFTLATYNAHDRGQPPLADIVAVQEAPDRLGGYFGIRFRVWQPARNRSLGIAHRRAKFTRTGRDIVKVHDGRAKVTPGRHVMWESYAEGIAVINTHAINNAFGPAIRGERRFRLAMWRRTLREVRRVRRQLRRDGYLPFVVGDLNRAGAFLLGMRDATPGQRYDRIFYVRSRRVKLLRSRYGKRRGSDHRPVVARFEVRARR